MEKIENAVFDTGPLIHLAEINKLHLLEIVKEKLAPDAVIKEFRNHRVEHLDLLTPTLSFESKDYAKTLEKEHFLDIGESEAISLAKQEDIKYFFTDDWYARNVAKRLNLNVHGTLGIVIRAYREKAICKSEAFDILDDLFNDSSLFITYKIINKGKRMLEEYEK